MLEFQVKKDKKMDRNKKFYIYAKLSPLGAIDVYEKEFSFKGPSRISGATGSFYGSNRALSYLNSLHLLPVACTSGREVLR